MKKNIGLFLTITALIFTVCTSRQALYSSTVKSIPEAKLSSLSNLHAFYQLNDKNSFEEIQKYFKNLKSVSFPWAKLEYNNGVDINKTAGKNSNYDYYFPGNYLKPLSYAKENGIQTQLSIFANFKTCGTILPDKALRTEAVNSIVNSLSGTASSGEAYSFDGVVIDFEGLSDKDVYGKSILIKGYPISKYLDTFLLELKSQLKKNGKQLFVAVQPKFSYNGYDYKTILNTADKVILMAHDFEPKSPLAKNYIMRYIKYNPKNPINSPAPIKLVKIALSDITSGASAAAKAKIILQINFDTTQWQFSNIASAKAWTSLPSVVMSGPICKPTYKTLKDRFDSIEKYGAYYTSSYITALETPYLAYYNSGSKTYNFILYENSRSIQAKIDAAKKYGVTGISIWKLDNMPNYTDITGVKYKLNIW